MTRKRFIIRSGLVFLFFIAIKLILLLLLTDEADFVGEWTPTQQTQHLGLLSTITAILTAPLALPLLGARMRSIGWSAVWTLPVYLLAVGAFLFEWQRPNDPLSWVSMTMFGITYLVLTLSGPRPAAFKTDDR